MKNSHVSISPAGLPTLGAVAFVILYVTATLFYPGGSQADATARGFSWANNYWCNLLNDQAINGQPNAAKPIALLAMFVLAISLTVFWWKFPAAANVSTSIKITIRFSGTLAMLAGLLLLTDIDHDLITNLASLLGIIAMTGTLMGLFINRWLKLFAFGGVIMLLVVLNNVFYYNGGLIVYLPVVQKLTFASFLLWIIAIDTTMTKARGSVN